MKIIAHLIFFVVVIFAILPISGYALSDDETYWRSLVLGFIFYLIVASVSFVFFSVGWAFWMVLI